MLLLFFILAEKTHYMAEMAKKLKPEIARLSYKSTIKKKKKVRQLSLLKYQTAEENKIKKQTNKQETVSSD